MSNQHEIAGRARKVAKLAVALGKVDAGSRAAAKMDQGAWRRLAIVAGVGPPSQETIDATIQTLAELESRMDTPADPFEDLGAPAVTFSHGGASTWTVSDD